MSRISFKESVRSPAVIIPLLALLLIPIGVFWFLNTFEREEYDKYLESSPEAYTNSLLAAERFLNKVGIKATSQSGMELLTTLPPTEDALVIRFMPAMLSEPVANNLLAWIEAGGHLLVVPPFETSDHPGAVDLLEVIGAGYVEEERPVPRT